jgi:hypothetical protein
MVRGPSGAHFMPGDNMSIAGKHLIRRGGEDHSCEPESRLSDRAPVLYGRSMRAIVVHILAQRTKLEAITHFR